MHDLFDYVIVLLLVWAMTGLTVSLFQRRKLLQKMAELEKRNKEHQRCGDDIQKLIDCGQFDGDFEYSTVHVHKTLVFPGCNWSIRNAYIVKASDYDDATMISINPKEVM